MSSSYGANRINLIVKVFHNRFVCRRLRVTKSLFVSFAVGGAPGSIVITNAWGGKHLLLGTDAGLLRCGSCRAAGALAFGWAVSTYVADHSAVVAGAGVALALALARR